MKKNAGFTLIELIAVMVILAIISVIAIPQFTDLRVDAANASAAGVGGAIASGSAINYAKGTANPGAAGVQAITACDADQLEHLLVGASYTAPDLLTVSGRQYVIAGAAAIPNGTPAECTIDDNAISGTTPQKFHVVGCAAGGACAS